MGQYVKFPVLEGQIAARGIRKTAIAKCIGCSDRTLYNKLIGKAPFSWDEVNVMNITFFPDMEPADLMRTDSRA